MLLYCAAYDGQAEPGAEVGYAVGAAVGGPGTGAWVIGVLPLEEGHGAVEEPLRAYGEPGPYDDRLPPPAVQ